MNDKLHKLVHVTMGRSITRIQGRELPLAIAEALQSQLSVIDLLMHGLSVTVPIHIEEIRDLVQAQSGPLPEVVIRTLKVNRDLELIAREKLIKSVTAALEIHEQLAELVHARSVDGEAELESLHIEEVNEMRRFTTLIERFSKDAVGEYVVGAHLVYNTVLSICVKLQGVYQIALRRLFIGKHFKKWGKQRKLRSVIASCEMLKDTEKRAAFASKESTNCRIRIAESHLKKIKAQESYSVPYFVDWEMLGDSLGRLTMQHLFNAIKQIALMERDMSVDALFKGTKTHAVWKKEHELIKMAETRWADSARDVDLFFNSRESVAQAHCHLRNVLEYNRLGEVVFKQRKAHAAKTDRLIALV